MKVAYPDLNTLGINLRLTEDILKDLFAQCQAADERRQKLIELWFRQEAEPTWEKLHEAISLCGTMSGLTSSLRQESDLSMNSNTTTSLFSPTSKYVATLCLKLLHICNLRY